MAMRRTPMPTMKKINFLSRSIRFLTFRVNLSWRLPNIKKHYLSISFLSYFFPGLLQIVTSHLNGTSSMEIGFHWRLCLLLWVGPVLFMFWTEMVSLTRLFLARLPSTVLIGLSSGS